MAGAAAHRPIEGMAAGALIGGGTGAAIGQSTDRKDASDYAARQAQAQQARIAANPPVGKDDVILMTKANVSPEVIVSKIESASYILPITTQDIVDMKNAGVSDKVTNAMLARLRVQANPPVETIVAPPAGPETRVEYYVEPGPWPYGYYYPRGYYRPYYRGRGRW